MPFAGDKAFVIAADMKIAAAVANIIPGLDSSVAGEVRRMGVHYSFLRHQVRKPGKVRRARRIEGCRQAARAHRIFRKGAPRDNMAGVAPAAMYGIEHYQPDPKDIGRLRTADARCSRVRPFGVPTDLRLRAHPVTYDLGYTPIIGPLQR